jgi:protein AbiQ
VTAKSVSGSNGVATLVAMWKHIAIFMGRIMQTDFRLYKVDMKYIRNLHRIDDKVMSVSPQMGKEKTDNEKFYGFFKDRN